MYIKIYDAYLTHKKIKVALIIYNFETFFFYKETVFRFEFLVKVEPVSKI